MMDYNRSLKRSESDILLIDLIIVRPSMIEFTVHLVAMSLEYIHPENGRFGLQLADSCSSISAFTVCGSDIFTPLGR